MSLCSFKTSRLKKIYRKLPERNKKFVFKRKKKKRYLMLEIFFLRGVRSDTGKPPRKKYNHFIIVTLW